MKGRDLKKISIPCQKRLSTDLTLLEKIFLVQIDSLDNDQNCYFLFGILKSQFILIVNSLEHENFIRICLIGGANE